jgi:hypothetical protein
MKIRVQVVIESGRGAPLVEEVAMLERGTLRPEEVGLKLEEAKELLRAVQQTMIAQQVEEYVDQQVHCPECGQPRPRKGKHEIVFRTLFGKLKLPSPRLYACRCRTRSQGSESPLAELLAERTAPELVYLEAKFAALISYGLTVDLLAEVLPIGEHLSVAAVHRQVQRVAEHVESELGEEQAQFIQGCPREWEALPPPGPPLVVGLDGGYVHANEPTSRAKGWFEVIAGKSVEAEGKARCFAFVNRYDPKPKRRLYEVLKGQGLQMNQRVVFLSDGGDTVRSLPTYLSPESEHYLDWFHITMRLTVLGQMTKGLALDRNSAAEQGGQPQSEEHEEDPTAGEIQRQLESVKWYLWHGNVYAALRAIQDLREDLKAGAKGSEIQRKLGRAVREFEAYIANNRGSIPNYGDRYRHGEIISTAFVESAVNQVVSKRFVKKQQMRWSERGAHLLLQIRTRVLNDELRDTFSRWYPGMMPPHTAAEQEQAA